MDNQSKEDFSRTDIVVNFIPSKKVIVHLMGGLGNQMFQYAFARSLALKTGSELILDAHLGFWLDKRFKRRFSLWFPHRRKSRSSLCDYVKSGLGRVMFGLCRKDGVEVRKVPLFGTVLIDRGSRVICCADQSKFSQIDGTIVLVGYWQQVELFETHSDKVALELMPPLPSCKNALELGAQMSNELSVMVGIRLYEEVSASGIDRKHSVKSAKEINGAISKVRQRIPNCRFYIFCTHRNRLLEELSIPSDSVYIIGNEKEYDEATTLWLMTQCYNHIITNSSFYWWGAWLGQHANSRKNGLVFMADNFDCSGVYWQKVTRF